MKRFLVILMGFIVLISCSKGTEDLIDPDEKIETPKDDPKDDPKEEPKTDPETDPKEEPGINPDFKDIIAKVLDFEKGASIDNSVEARTSLTHDTYFSSWRTGDEIGVATLQGGFFNTQSKLGIVEVAGAGTASGPNTFHGETVLNINDNYSFYYPYNKKNLDGGIIEFDMPIQIETGNYSYENFAVCDFLFCNQLLKPGTNRSAFLVDDAANLEFTHGVAVIQIEVSKSSFQGAGVENINTIYSVELRSRDGGSIFPQKVTLDANGDLKYSDNLRSMFLFAGNNGYDLSKSVNGFGGFLIMFPLGNSASYKAEVQFLIHTNAGIFIANKRLPQIIAHNYYTLSFDNATLSEDVYEWSEDLSAPSFEGKEIFITSASELAWIAALSNGKITDPQVTDITFKGYTVILKNNIDLGGKYWTPINNFRGTIEGYGKSISNIKIMGNKDNQGLIGVNKGGVIKDLTINYPEIIVRAKNIGAFVGNCESGVVANCKVINGTVNGINNVGGLVGKDNYSIANDCINNGTIVTALESNVGKRAGSSPNE